MLKEIVMQYWKNALGGCLVAVLFALMGCGGGGGNSSSSSIISGTASQGAALAAGSTVYLKDAKGVEKTTSIVGDNGSYSIVVDGLTAPFVLRAGTYYSFSSVPGTVNVNPFTHLCMVNILGTTDLTSFYGNSAKPPAAESLNALASNIKAAVDDLKTKIDAIYGSTVPASQRDFFNGTIVIGAGVDRIFENIVITSTASGFTIKQSGQSGTLVSGTRDQNTGMVTLTTDSTSMAAFSSYIYPRNTNPVITVAPSDNGVFVIQGNNLDGVAGIDLVVRYDPSVLSSPSVVQGSLVAASGAVFAANPTFTQSSIKIAIINTKPFSGSGPIATISFAAHTGTGNVVVSSSFINGTGAPIYRGDDSGTLTSTSSTRVQAVQP